jgi:hypothetical protein
MSAAPIEDQPAIRVECGAAPRTGGRHAARSVEQHPLVRRQARKIDLLCLGDFFGRAFEHWLLRSVGLARDRPGGRVDSIGVGGTHRKQDVARHPVVRLPGAGHKDDRPPVGSDVGAEVEAGGRLAGKSPPHGAGRVEGPHVGEVGPVVSAADNHEARLRIVDGDVAGARRHAARCLHLAPPPRPEIEQPRVRQVRFLAVAPEQHQCLVTRIADHACVHPGRRLHGERQLSPRVLRDAVNPGSGVPADFSVGPALGHMAAPEQDKFIVQRVVCERASEHRRRGMPRPKVRPAASRDVVHRGQPAGEEVERVVRGAVSHLVEDDVEVGPGDAFLLVSRSPHHGPLAPRGDAGVRSRDIGERQAAAPALLPQRRQVALPATLREIEGHHVVLGDFHQRMFLEQVRVVVHVAPEEEGVRFGGEADGAAGPRAGGVLGDLHPTVRRQVGCVTGERGQRQKQRDCGHPLRHPSGSNSLTGTLCCRAYCAITSRNPSIQSSSPMLSSGAVR